MKIVTSTKLLFYCYHLQRLLPCMIVNFSFLSTLAQVYALAASGNKNKFLEALPTMHKRNKSREHFPSTKDYCQKKIAFFVLLNSSSSQKLIGKKFCNIQTSYFFPCHKSGKMREKNNFTRFSRKTSFS